MDDNDKGDRSQLFSSFLSQKQMHIEGANDAPVLHGVQNVFICTACLHAVNTMFYVAQNCETEFNKPPE